MAYLRDEAGRTVTQIFAGVRQIRCSYCSWYRKMPRCGPGRSGNALRTTTKLKAAYRAHLKTIHEQEPIVVELDGITVVRGGKTN
jgi:hypothetical protein